MPSDLLSTVEQARSSYSVPAHSTPVLCHHRAQAEPTTAFCHSPSLSPFLSGLFHTPVLYRSPLVRIISSSFLEKGLGEQNSIISVLTGRALWVERGNFSWIDARKSTSAPSLD